MDTTREESEISKDADSVPIEHMEEDCSSLQFMAEQQQHEKHHVREQDDYTGHEFPTEVQALNEPVTCSHHIIEANAHPILDITIVDSSTGDHDNKDHPNTNSSKIVVNPQIICCDKSTYGFGISDSGVSLQTNLEINVDNSIDSSCVDDASRCKAMESFGNCFTDSDRNTEIGEKIMTNNIGDAGVFRNGDGSNAIGLCGKSVIKCNSVESGNFKIEDPDEETGEVNIACGEASRGDPDRDIKNEILKLEEDPECSYGTKNVHPLRVLDMYSDEGDQSGTEEEQALFMAELEVFFKERSMEFKPPKFYGEGLNCIKLWRAVIKLGGYEQVTSNKLWRQVGELFNPPKTCTTVSWTFRCFYEKALLEFEKYKLQRNVSPLSNPQVPESNIECQISNNPTPGRARRDAAARAMQGWHSNRLLGEEDVVMGSPLKRDKQQKLIGPLKRKKTPIVDHATKASAQMKSTRTQFDRTVMDIGTPADWVKINVHKTHDCFEVYVLVPGLLREEVHVQSDPVGRLVITGQPEELDNPWGVTPFKKVVSLPSRIDAHQTSAVVTLYGQLFVRVPFEHT